MVKKLLLSWLLLGGDIQLNPAPKMRYLCGACNKLAKRNQKGIQCDNCDLQTQNAAQLVIKCTISLLAHLVHRYVVDCGLSSFFLWSIIWSFQFLIRYCRNLYLYNSQLLLNSLKLHLRGRDVPTRIILNWIFLNFNCYSIRSQH